MWGVKESRVGVKYPSFPYFSILQWASVCPHIVRIRMERYLNWSSITESQYSDHCMFLPLCFLFCCLKVLQRAKTEDLFSILSFLKERWTLLARTIHLKDSYLDVWDWDWDGARCLVGAWWCWSENVKWFATANLISHGLGTSLLEKDHQTFHEAI
jgi:hypothetical protein